MLWVAEDDPLKMEALNKMPALDYFIMVDKKLAQAKKDIQTQRK